MWSRLRSSRCANPDQSATAQPERAGSAVAFDRFAAALPPAVLGPPEQPDWSDQRLRRLLSTSPESISASTQRDEISACLASMHARRVVLPTL